MCYLQYFQKTAIALVLMILLPFMANAQYSVHAILIIDSNDAETRSGHLANRDLIRAELDSASRYARLQFKVYPIESEEFTVQKIQEVLQNISLKNDDALFVYYSGREHISASGPKEHSQVLLLNDGTLSFKALEAMIAEKNAHLKVLLGDFCNKFSSSQKHAERYTLPTGSRYVSLLLKASGMVVGSNHVPRDQFELTVSPQGGYFSHAFVEALRENASAETRWETVMARLRFFAIRRSKGALNPQVFVKISEQQAIPNSYNVYKEDVAVEGTKKHHSSSAEAKMSELPTKEEIEASSSDTGLSSAEVSQLLSRSLMQVGDFQTKLTSLADASTPDKEEIIQSLQKLFASETKTIEVSSISGGRSKRGIKAYFSKLFGDTKRYTVSIQWYKPTQMGGLIPKSSNIYTCTATVYQEYRKTNAKGKLVYGDRTTKKVEVIVEKNDAGEWQTRLGNVSVVPNSTEALEGMSSASTSSKSNENTETSEVTNEGSEDW